MQGGKGAFFDTKQTISIAKHAFPKFTVCKTQSVMSNGVLMIGLYTLDSNRWAPGIRSINQSIDVMLILMGHQSIDQPIHQFVSNASIERWQSINQSISQSIENAIR